MVALRDGLAVVALPRAVACQACLDGRGCGVGLWRLSSQAETTTITIIADERPLRAGQQVSVDCIAPSVARVALLGYGLPLAGLLLSASIGDAFLGPGATIVLAGLGLGSGFLAARRLAARRFSAERTFRFADPA